MQFEDAIIQLMRGRDYVPLKTNEFAERLNLSKNRITTLQRELRILVESGRIVRTKNNRFCLPQDADLQTGTIRFRQSGRALFIPDPLSGEVESPSLLVRARDTGVAMDRDRVLVRRKRPKRRSYRYQMGRKGKAVATPESDNAQVIRVLKRARNTITGTLKRSHLYHFVIPDDPKIIYDILVPNPRTSGIRPTPAVDDKVVVNLKEWKERHLSPEGEITALLGKTTEPSAESRALLHRYGLNVEFPPSVIKEVQKLPQAVRVKDLQNRLDLRHQLTLTIDPVDAKDFDDALSVECLESGETRVGVHIADVSAYLRPGSVFDKQAQRRGNSTYLVDQVIPMLPHALSNGICSLIEGEDRLTKSVFLTFSAKGRIKSTEFANTVIHSRKRLTYPQARALLTEDNLDEIRRHPPPPKHQTGFAGRPLSKLSDKELLCLRDTIRKLWRLAIGMRNRRMNKGSLDLDAPEFKIYVDKKGYADRIEQIQFDESHQLIEEFMLAANEAVAKALHGAQLPFLHRVHDKPDRERLAELREFLARFNLKVGDLNNRKEITRLLRMIRAHPQSAALRIEFLRSMKQACYRTDRDGHFGLNKLDYTHFTSPIRRYSDLNVHRVLNRFLTETGHRTALSKSPRKYRISELRDLAQHLSITERNSVEAERESVKLKLLEFFEREARKREKSKFEAVIIDIRNHGFFVELKKSMAFGLVHTSGLPPDLYALNSDGTALVGRRRQNSFTLGQEIDVTVERVDRLKQHIDFALCLA